MTAVAVLVVSAIAGAITYIAMIAAGTHRETHDLQAPVSRRALEQLQKPTTDWRERNGTRW